MHFPRHLLAEDCTCGPQATVLKIEYSSLLLVSEPEFHEEWLRDGPCDATTTGLGNSGVWCQLSPRQRVGNMRFGVHSFTRISLIPAVLKYQSSSRSARASVALELRDDGIILRIAL